MVRVLAAMIATAVSSTAAFGGEPSAHRPRVIGIERAEAGVGRCTSDGVCTFSPGDGKVVRAASVVSRGTGARAVKHVRPRPAVPSV